MGLRVQLLAWRTLRCRVEDAGSLGDQALYRVGNLRLVLSPDGKHFRRVVACSSCGRLRATRRPVTAADLHVGSYFDLCARCAPESARPMDLGDLDRVLSDEGGERPAPGG